MTHSFELAATCVLDQLVVADSKRTSLRRRYKSVGVNGNLPYVVKLRHVKSVLFS